MAKFFLLADDDNDDAELFAEALSGITPSVEFRRVENGESVFDFLDTPGNKIPDILFLDLNMPVMNGWQCLSRLRNEAHYKELPVIIYSTSSHQRDRSIAHDLGANGFFIKPSDFKTLKRVLARLASENGKDLQKILGEINLI